jgi:hypothetical protein
MITTRIRWFTPRPVHVDLETAHTSKALSKEVFHSDSYFLLILALGSCINECRKNPPGKNPLGKNPSGKKTHFGKGEGRDDYNVLGWCMVNSHTQETRSSQVLGMNYALPSRGKVKLMRVIKMQNS